MKKIFSLAIFSFFFTACFLSKDASHITSDESASLQAEAPELSSFNELSEPEISLAESQPAQDDTPAQGEAASDRKVRESTLVSAFTMPAFSGRSVSLGVNASELNPANYQKINKEAMEGMGMAPSYAAYLAGEKFYGEGNYERAIAEFGIAISLKADYADAYVLRGNALRRKGELNKAIDDYSRAINLKSNYAEVYNYRGFVFDQKGDLSRAIADYTQAIRFRADYADAYFNRAYAYGRLGDWDRAIADYTQVIRLEPLNATAFNQRGSAWYSKGDKTKAFADYDAAEKLGF
jgi:tetratricopeptide (TPR) repeat protein